MQIGDLVIDPATREVRRCGFAIALTRTDFILLEMLMRNAGRVITRTRMIEAVWGHEREIENNTLDVINAPLPGTYTSHAGQPQRYLPLMRKLKLIAST